MKLKVTNLQIQMQKFDLIENMSKTIKVAKNMIMLDLSWSQLQPQDLYEISVALTTDTYALRNLNLSYNKLQFQNDENKLVVNQKDVKYSEAFMENMITFMYEALFINHINFSGMNFDFDKIMHLLKIIKKCNFIIAIHLNNNGLALNTNYFKQIMKLFNIKEADLVACGRSQQQEALG